MVAVKTIFLGHLIWEHFYAVSDLRGPSMLPTFEVMGDSAIVDKWYRRGRGIQVGDIVSFDSVVEPGEKVLKRVLGLEGDYVLSNTPGGDSDTMIQVSLNCPILENMSDLLQVPQGHCWVVGDNLPASRDSRMFGPLPMALINGKITYRLFPFFERGRIENMMLPVS
jgi:inner membrane protease subunit 1